MSGKATYEARRSLVIYYKQAVICLIGFSIQT